MCQVFDDFVVVAKLGSYFWAGSDMHAALPKPWWQRTASAGCVYFLTQRGLFGGLLIGPPSGPTASPPEPHSAHVNNFWRITLLIPPAPAKNGHLDTAHEARNEATHHRDLSTLSALEWRSSLHVYAARIALQRTGVFSYGAKMEGQGRSPLALSHWHKCKMGKPEHRGKKPGGCEPGKSKWKVRGSPLRALEPLIEDETHRDPRTQSANHRWWKIHTDSQFTSSSGAMHRHSVSKEKLDESLNASCQSHQAGFFWEPVCGMRPFFRITFWLASAQGLWRRKLNKIRQHFNFHRGFDKIWNLNPRFRLEL